MKIGIDIDDTITNTYEILVKLIAEKYNLDAEEILERKPNYDELYDNLPNFDKVRKEIFMKMASTVPLKENVSEVLTKLKEHGNEIIFITARSNVEYDDPYQVSYDYLTKNKVPFDKLYVNVLDKGIKCVEENIDVFIDDDDTHCIKVTDKNIHTLQFDSLKSIEILGIERVYSWKEIYELLTSSISS